jgi:hypothetical protein
VEVWGVNPAEMFPSKIVTAIGFRRGILNEKVPNLKF